MSKIALFVDVQNIYYTTREAHARQFDYTALLQQLAASGDIVCAIAYAIDRGDSKQQKFQHALQRLGFTVKLKPFIQRSDGSAKGDWDVGITIDILDHAPNSDLVVLLSGDGDFALLLDTVKQRFGVRTEVYGVPALTARSLINVVDAFHAIDDSLLR